MDTVPPFIAAGKTTSSSTAEAPATPKASSLRKSPPLIVSTTQASKSASSLSSVKSATQPAPSTPTKSPKGSKFLINGEPTDNRIAIASKGALRVELRAKGRMAHSAYPELGDSAIDKLVEALHDILALPLPSEPEIGPATMNIGILSGGYAPNVISDKAEAHILIRTVGPSDESKKSIAAIVGGRVDVTFSLDLPFVRMRKMETCPP